MPTRARVAMSGTGELSSTSVSSTTLMPCGVESECMSSETLSAFFGYVNVTWVLMCTFFVISMQLGFAMLEVGSCRSEHRHTVVLKNVLDSSVSCLCFWAFSNLQEPSIIHGEDTGVTQEHLMLFHSAFCATSVTICSGSMAERTHMGAYLCYAVLMAGIIYPVMAEATWGSRQRGFLHDQFHEKFHADYSYHDFAGGGVVHLAGGCAALVGNTLLGRRIRKPSQGFTLPTEFPSHTASMMHDLEGLVDDTEDARPPEGWARRFDNAEADEAQH